MGQTADEIRRELDAKRHELTRDIDRIEEKVTSTFDIRQQVDRNPLLATGLAVFGGFLLGNMLGGGKRQETPRRDYRSYGGYYEGHGYPATGYSYSQYAQPSSYRPPQPESGFKEQAGHLMSDVRSGVSQSFRRESGSGVEGTITNLSAALTALLVDKAKEMLDRNLPGFSEKYEQAQQQSHMQHRGQENYQERTASTTATTSGDSGTGTSDQLSGQQHSTAPASSSTYRTTPQ